MESTVEQGSPLTKSVEQGSPLTMRRDALELAARIDALFAESGGREREALELILRTARNARRSARRALPVPQAGVDAMLLLVEALAAGGLGEPLP